VRLLTFTALAVLLTLSACSSGQAAPTTSAVPATTPPTTAAATTTTTPAPSTTTTSTTVAVNPPSPLNGLPADDVANLERRVIAVKIDNHANARPQSGIEKADAVYELPVEASLTRFIALFHDNDSTYLGPMRSGRPTDPTLLLSLGATFVISGAQDWVQGVIRNYGVPFLGEIRPATFRVRGRFAPHNLYVDTTQLRVAADGRGYSNDPPPLLFAWGAMAADAQEATEIFFDWSSSTRVTWMWDEGRYVRWTGGVTHDWISQDGETRQPITADTLVVLFARRYTASGSTGSSVPAMDTVGTGRALVFSGGLVAEGTWSRDGAGEVFTLTDAAGEALTVPVGVPWISIFPDNRQVSW